MLSSIARALSIIGHPLVTLPVMACLLVAWRERDPWSGVGVAIGFLAFAAIVMGWSSLNVKRGKWQHVDASLPAERRTLNRFLLAGITIGAALAWTVFDQRMLGLCLGLSALLIAFAAATAHWWKLSLHASFATFATLLLWPFGAPALAIGGLATGAIAWSRWYLGRHQLRDLVAGVASGGVAGLLLWQAVEHWPAMSQ